MGEFKSVNVDCIISERNGGTLDLPIKTEVETETCMCHPPSSAWCQVKSGQFEIKVNNV